MRIVRSAGLGALVVAMVGGGPVLRAQSAVIRGVVSDSSGRGLPGVEVQLRGLTQSVTTGPDGEFRVEQPKGSGFWLVARREGLRPVQLNGRVRRRDSGVVRLTMVSGPSEASPSGSLVPGQIQDYVWQSRAANHGRFLTGQEALAFQPTSVAAAPPAQTPLVSAALGAVPVQPYGEAPPPSPGAGAPPSSPEPTPSWYFVPSPPQYLDVSSASRVSNRCSPLVSLNGLEVSATLSLSDVAPSDVQAVEIYPGIRAPLAGSPESPVSVRARCGVVVVWIMP